MRLNAKTSIRVTTININISPTKVALQPLSQRVSCLMRSVSYKDQLPSAQITDRLLDESSHLNETYNFQQITSEEPHSFS